MPIFNASPTLQLCLEALRRELNQEGDYELICIDNGSTDDSIEIVRAFPEASLLRESRPGPYAARNRGAQAASGDILVFTDPDCVGDSGWLRAAGEAFDDSSCLVALGARRPAPDRGLIRLLGDYEIAKDRWVLSSGEPEKYYGFTNNMAVRRNAWDSHGPFDDARLRGGDTIFIRRLVDAEGCRAVQFIPGMRVSHLEIDGALTYLKKTFTYGRSLQSYSQAVPARPLSFRNRVRVFLDASRDNGYDLVLFVSLSGLLIAGIAAWLAGRLVGFLKPDYRVSHACV